MESKTLVVCSPAQLMGHVEPLGFRIALKTAVPLHKHLQHMEQTHGMQPVKCLARWWVSVHTCQQQGDWWTEMFCNWFFAKSPKR